MEPEGVLLCSWEPDIGLCPELDKSSPLPPQIILSRV
jgi:hypothetical protein